MRLIRCALAVVVVGVGLLAQTGCGEKSTSPVPLKTVTGTVTFNGSPLPQGTITFMPVAGSTSATGEIKDGKYTLSTFKPGDGAPAGDYKVAVQAWKAIPEMGQEGDPLIPKKYFGSNQSTLTAKVTDQSPQTLDFTLQP